MKELEKNYDHKKVEEGKFDFWKEKGYFKGGLKENADKKPFSMILPPPNVTGILHIGHAKNTTTLDIVGRYKKLTGYDVEFVPGTDHAGIATQAKVEANLKKEGISRYDLGREKFIEKSYEWKEQCSNYIHSQWKMLGLGMDYDKERFTMDEKTCVAVNKVFCDLYEQGLIYQGERIINWDPELQTALSNIEVEHIDIPGKFYYFKYKFVDSDEYLTIATTRPETMFGDTAVVFNPKDERYKGMEGKLVINPANGEPLPLVADYYVDMEFGTGAMKCTPAHDPNDFEIGRRHGMKNIVCMNKDGTMNDAAGIYKGMDRFECRDALVKKIESEGNLIKIEDVVHSVGHSERSHVIVEPTLSKQWFIRMKPLVDDILKLQSDPKTKMTFFPERFEKTFTNWLENTDDWCISRQLWWGHRIPIYYHRENGEIKCSPTPLDPTIWKQDEDVLDTWFSSALSPFALMGWPNTDEADYSRFYPLDVMITAYDIIFFWVARMAAQGVHFTGKLPFKKVYIHGLVRDSLGRKMSKSLGNGIDPNKVIDEYGADSLRYALSCSGAPGLDMPFGTEKVKSAHNFLNKVWNSARFLLSNLTDDFVPSEVKKEDLTFIDQYLYAELDKTIDAVKFNMEKYELGQATQYVYNFVYDVFCSNYLELTKVDLKDGSEERKNVVRNILTDVLKKVLIMLFPFTPFITEEIYLSLPNHKDSIYEESYPENSGFELDASLGESLIEMIKYVRSFKSENGFEPTAKVILLIDANDELISQLTPYLTRLAFAENVKHSDKQDGMRYFEHIGLLIEADESILKERIQKRIEELHAEIARSNKILSNPNFLAKAKPEKVELEKSKLAAYEAELAKYTK